jgi:hypothetical protein
MQESLTDERIARMAAEWLPVSTPLGRIHRDTSDFFKVEYGDVVVLGRRAFLVGHNAKEGRFGLDDEVKHWVKRCIDLHDGSRKIVKLVFHEKFKSSIADLSFDCFRSPRKEARILDLVADHDHFMHGYWVKDDAGNIVRVIDYIYCPSIAECILQEAEATQSETILVGRKGVSRKEELLFGSVSNRIIHQAEDCTVWVVE